jgi:hypothetical protein
LMLRGPIDVGIIAFFAFTVLSPCDWLNGGGYQTAL